MKIAEEKKLIKEYKIHFKGRVPISHWPGRYAGVFERALSVSKFTFDIYTADCQETSDSVFRHGSYKSRLSARARMLSSVAPHLARKRANEQKWRLKVEQLVFERFDQEITCQNCRSKRWESEIKAVSDDLEAAQRLQRKQVKRSLCTCNHADQISTIEEPFESYIFDDQASERMLYDTEDSADSRLPAREPDRVIGLQHGNVFDRLLYRLPHDFANSPFRTETPIFPFLIAEAKSEKGGQGWDAIERQSAFPIRSLLKIQASMMLHLHRSYSINPLVWFLAWEGAEWRVYAATWDEGACASTKRPSLNRDDALRLILLMDHIYDWARDVYRPNILRSLEYPHGGVRGVTPSDSRVESIADSNQTSSMLQRPPSIIYKYVYENGRTYHAFREGAYPLPNDEIERDRLDLLHHIFKMTLNGELITTPIQHSPQRVLDIGTGTGIWAIQFADKYPSAEVIGSDLSPIQPLWVPRNCIFEIDDVESEWLFSRDEVFDLIHGRAMAGSIQNWPQLYENAYKHLSPGGWVEIQDFELEFRSNNGSLEAAVSLRKWQDEIKEASIKFGKRLNVAAMQKQMMSDAGFVDVTEYVYEVPIGPWNTDPKLKEMGMYALRHMLEAIDPFSLALFSRVLGWKRIEIQVFLAGVRADLRNLDLQLIHHFHFVSGRKP